MSDATVGATSVPTVAFARGADQRFAELYATQFEKLAGYAYRLTRDAELSHDLAQEAFIRLYVRWFRVRAPRAFLFHVVTNLVRDAWQASQREHRALAAVDPPASLVAGPDRTVADAIARLPERHREVVLLHYYADLTTTDIAAAVRRPSGTVKRLLAEARSLLAQSLGDPDA